MYISSIVLLLTLAQAPTTNGVPQAKAKAQELLTEGSGLYERGDYAGALDKFKAAYAAYPSPKLMFNIGQANRDLGRPVEALEAFEKFVASEPDRSEATAADARDLIVQLQSNLGRIRIECTIAGSEVSVDGKSIGTTPLPKPIWATQGRHQVTASHSTGAGAIENVQVTAGEITFLTLRPQALAMALTPVPHAAPNEAGRVPGAMPQDRDELDAQQSSQTSNRGWWLGRKWTWIAAGSTLLLATGATVSGLAMQSKFDSLKSSCGPACSDSDIASVRTRRDLANVLWGLTGAAAVTTGLLIWVEGHPATIAPTVGLATGFTAKVAF